MLSDAYQAGVSDALEDFNSWRDEFSAHSGVGLEKIGGRFERAKSAFKAWNQHRTTQKATNRVLNDRFLAPGGDVHNLNERLLGADGIVDSLRKQTLGPQGILQNTNDRLLGQGGMIHHMDERLMGDQGSVKKLNDRLLGQGGMVDSLRNQTVGPQGILQNANDRLLGQGGMVDSLRNQTVGDNGIVKNLNDQLLGPSGLVSNVDSRVLGDSGIVDNLGKRILGANYNRGEGLVPQARQEAMRLAQDAGSAIGGGVGNALWRTGLGAGGGLAATFGLPYGAYKGIQALAGPDRKEKRKS